MSNAAKGSTPTAQQPSAQPPPWRSPLWEQYGGCGQKVEVEDVDWADRAYVPHSSEPLKFYFSWRKLWRFAGPGWLMSLAYLDPGNLESNLQQGAYTRYELVWVLWWSTFTGLLLQEMSARIALVTGRDLAQTVREEYPLWLSRLIYVMMEVHMRCVGHSAKSNSCCARAYTHTPSICTCIDASLLPHSHGIPSDPAVG